MQRSNHLVTLAEATVKGGDTKTASRCIADGVLIGEKTSFEGRYRFCTRAVRISARSGRYTLVWQTVYDIPYASPTVRVQKRWAHVYSRIKPRTREIRAE